MIALSAHAVLRCQERHGFTPTAAQGDAAVLDIIERRAVLLGVRPGGKEDWLVRLGPFQVRVVYAPEAALIVTVLAPESRPAAKIDAFRASRLPACREEATRYLRGKRLSRRTVWERRA